MDYNDLQNSSGCSAPRSMRIIIHLNGWTRTSTNETFFQRILFAGRRMTTSILGGEFCTYAFSNNNTYPRCTTVSRPRVNFWYRRIIITIIVELWPLYILFRDLEKVIPMVFSFILSKYGYFKRILRRLSLNRCWAIFFKLGSKICIFNYINKIIFFYLVEW